MRLVEGEEVVDDYRVVREHGETYEPSQTISSFNAVLDEWELISVDKDKGLHDFGTGGREGGERKLNFLVDTGAYPARQRDATNDGSSQLGAENCRDHTESLGRKERGSTPII